jgi:hypothetical protein
METTVKVRSQGNKISLVTLSQSAAGKLKERPLAGDMPPEEGGKPSEQLQDLELVRRSHPECRRG